MYHYLLKQYHFNAVNMVAIGCGLLSFTSLNVCAQQQIDLPAHVWMPEQTMTEQMPVKPTTLHISPIITSETEQKSHSPTYIVLNQVPLMIDKLPTLLPAESDQIMLPSIEDTKDRTWWDRKQYQFKYKLQNYAHHIDDWFGQPDPDQPAYANLRIIMDTRWDKYDDFSIKPRIRGKLKLPTLENRWSVVFGDDALDNEIRDSVAINNENPIGNTNKTLDTHRSRTDNTSLALRWSEWKNPFDIETDVDLGVRSGDDIYLRLKAQKDWQLQHDFSTHAEQIYRYGIDSKHYLRTNLELRHARPNQAFLSDQLSLIYTDDGHQDFYWENRLFRQHQFFYQNYFNYGVYTSGRIENSTPDLNSYGPFISWRQPFIREWLFIQTEANYYNDKERNRSHYLGGLLRLEAWF